MNIICPKCQHTFTNEESINHHEQLKLKLLGEMAEKEASLLQQKRILDEQEKTQMALIERAVNLKLKESEAIQTKRLEEDFCFKLAEKDKQIKDMEKKLHDAKRIAEQGSQQNQGEVVEEHFEERLKRKFPFDLFSEVKKGQEGGDLLQTVMSSAEQTAGKILWEFKNTKNFSPSWVQKILSDQQRAGAEMGIIVSKARPKEGGELELMNGVYVVSYELALPLAEMLRRVLSDLSYARACGENQSEKIQMIYQYITGPKFKQKLQQIINAFKEQKEILEREKRALKKIWSEREKQLELVMDSVSSLYGDMVVITGRAIAPLEDFELLKDE